MDQRIHPYLVDGEQYIKITTTQIDPVHYPFFFFWECLGLKEKPSWFDTTYGMAPHTSNTT